MKHTFASNKTHYQKGFTLIELLVVVAIIGILTAVALTSLSGARDKAKKASVMTSMSSLRSQAEQLRNVKGFFVDDTTSSPNAASGTNTFVCSNQAFKTIVRAAGKAAGYGDSINSGVSPASGGYTATIGSESAVFACSSSSRNFAAIIDLDRSSAASNWFCVDDSGVSKQYITGSTVPGILDQKCD